MDTLPKSVRTGPGLLAGFLALLSAPNLLSMPPAAPTNATACAGPAVLEAKAHTHPDGDAYAALGNWFGENRKPECAIRAFQSGIKLEPSSPRLNYLLGLSYYTAGHLEEAVAPLRQSIQLDPGQDKTHLLLAATLTSLGRGKEAVPEWSAALRIDPNSKMALDGLAKALTDAGDYDSVIQHLAKIDRDETLDLDLAIAYGKANMLDDAAQVLTESLKKHPDSDNLTRALVVVYVKQTRYQEGSKLAEKLAARNPKDIEAQRIYLRILVLNGENDVAAPLGAKLLALAPHDPDFLYLNGILERETGDYATARKHLEEAATLNPNHYNTRYNLGVVLAQMHENAEAKVQLEKAIELGAQEPEVRFELSKVLRALGETDAAQEQLKLYQKGLKEKSDRTLGALKSTQAEQAIAAGDKQKAAALYKEACTALPSDASLAYRWALVLQDLNDLDGERAALEQAVKANPRYAPAQYQLGYLESRGGDNAAAEKLFRLAVESAPRYTDAWVALAATLAMESRFPEAQDAVAVALKIEPDNPGALELRKNLTSGQAAR
jgi:tetratricopeptide (TPR) repeat protein